MAALMSCASFREWLAPERYDRIVVVAPHPDDEVLGCAGLLLVAVALLLAREAFAGLLSA